MAASNSSSSSEDEEEAQRRRELLSCVVSGEDICKEAVDAPKRKKEAKEAARNGTADQQTNIHSGSQINASAFQQHSGRKLIKLLDRIFEPAFCESEWDARWEEASRSKPAKRSKLHLFSTSSTAFKHKPPNAFAAAADARACSAPQAVEVDLNIINTLRESIACKSVLKKKKADKERRRAKNACVKSTAEASAERTTDESTRRALKDERRKAKRAAKADGKKDAKADTKRDAKRKKKS
eukprot:4685561-Pleurochrysis_carterae.AAC.2